MMGAKKTGICLLVCGGRKSSDLRAQCPRKSQRQVSKSTDSDDTDTIPRVRQSAQRRVDRNAGTKQRCGLGGLHYLWNWDGKTVIRPYTLREAAEARYSSGSRLIAQILEASLTPLAFVARATLPTDTHALPNGQTAHSISDRGDDSNHLMAWHEWVPG